MIQLDVNEPLLTDREIGVLKAYHFLKNDGAEIPDELQLAVDIIYEEKAWVTGMGRTLEAGPIGPFG